MGSEGGGKGGNDGIRRGMHTMKEEGRVFGSHKVGWNNAEFGEHGEDRSRFRETAGGTNSRGILFRDKGGELGIIAPDGRGPHGDVLNTVKDNLTFFVNVEIFS